MVRQGVPKGRTCALDLGRARVGVAIDDELGMLAHPRGFISGRDRKALVEAVKRFAEEENVVRFVVGLPLRMSGREGPEAREARAVAQAIADATGREVVLWDERLTSKQADRELAMSGVNAKDRKERVDAVAACAILQAWMDARSR